MAVRPVRFIALVCGVMAFSLAEVCAEEPPLSHEAVSSTAAAPAVDESSVKLITPDQIAKKQKAYLGLAALAGIVIIGVALGALTILWGGRLRRQLRKSDPECAATDRSFWFLKPPKPSVTRSSLPELNRPLDAPPSQASPPSEPE